MRIVRKNRIVGQFLILLLTLALAGWWVHEVRSGTRFSTYAPLPEATIERVEFPPAELKQRIPPLLEAMDRLPESEGTLTELDMELFLTPEEVAFAERNAVGEERQFAPASLSLLLLNHQRYAVLDGRALQEGNVLQDGRIVRSIDEFGVVLEWPPSRSIVGGLNTKLERVSWIPYNRVELKRPAAGPALREAPHANAATPTPDMPQTSQEEAP